ncbi:Pre-rRNA-processing protein TSR1 like [Dissostichus eleginoides]|uniref:Pre-rRNA-processing protein TSR1 like n=1 Tax=Dissostichus eleginoides TaxID=100907 RepID=A0AAD9CE34_DISEL|nr:Pre-rRNA-processing protein TSR1 like [Dissostichus eleginoides]
MLDEAMEDEDNVSQDPGSEEEEEEEEDEEEEEVCAEERTGVDERYDEHIDLAAEEEGLKRYREARSNEMFPDEVDTPLDMPARIRYQRYRGLKSFRSHPGTPWRTCPSTTHASSSLRALSALATAYWLRPQQRKREPWWAGMLRYTSLMSPLL